MGFLRDDEFILLMDTPLQSGRMLTVDELRMLHDAGIRTAVWCGPIWDDFLQDDFRTFRWEYFDQQLERMRQADLKCLIPLWWKQSTRYPADFYVKRLRGYVFGCFSPWNKEAQDRSNKLLAIVRDQLTSDTVQITSAQYEGGERVLLNEPAYFDEHALKDWQKNHWGAPNHKSPEGTAWLRDSYTRLLLSQQRILVETQHREIWYMLSRWKAQVWNISCHGCEWIDHYLAEFKKLEPTSINHISFNYFPYGMRIYPVIAREREDWGVNEFVGAEYCDGMRAGNGRLAVRHGLRGMIVGPTHPFSHHEGIEPWMVETIAKTNKLFMEREFCYAG